MDMPQKAANHATRESEMRVRFENGADAILHYALASTRTSTAMAPAFCNALAHSRSVAPVVQTSSTRSARRPCTMAVSALNAPCRLVRRSAPERVDCGRVSRSRRNAFGVSGAPVALATAPASSRLWLKPRQSKRFSCRGTGTIKVGWAGGGANSLGSFCARCHAATAKARSRAACSKRELYLKVMISSRSGPSYWA